VDTFQALSAEALKSNNQAFITLPRAGSRPFKPGERRLETRQKAIDALVAPLKESLTRYESRSLRWRRPVKALTAHSKSTPHLATTNQQLQEKTSALTITLKGGPQVRGRWGNDLRNVAELAGMSGHCDFTEQETFTSESGRLRPT